MKNPELQPDRLSIAIHKVFANRKTLLKRPLAFTAEFYTSKEAQQRWSNFLSTMGKEQLRLEDVIQELSKPINRFFEIQPR